MQTPKSSNMATKTRTAAMFVTSQTELQSTSFITP